ncbi:MAG: DUF6152 family protein [Pseudomonadota bacterium]
MKINLAILLAFAATAMCAAAQAHHSNTAYDTGKSVQWQVAVTEFKFVNPHAYVFFTMQDGNGKSVDGRCELSARTMLTRMGWTVDSLKPGEKVTVKGSPGRNEANVCLLNSFTRANGAVIGAHQQLSQ